jgi:hypothetical protein
MCSGCWWVVVVALGIVLFDVFPSPSLLVIKVFFIALSKSMHPPVEERR